MSRRPTTPAPGHCRGQASVELVALLPLVAAVALAAMQLLAAGMASELAGNAAEAGAVAILQDRDPRDAARDAVPGWSRGRMKISVKGDHVAVTLRPPAPTDGIAELLSTTAHAHAGASQ